MLDEVFDAVVVVDFEDSEELELELESDPLLESEELELDDSVFAVLDDESVEELVLDVELDDDFDPDRASLR